MTRTAAEIRQEFIDFFRAHGHTFVPSSPVVPHDDPTLLFTNAGMNQFKPYFLGTETLKHTRVANTQKCIRAGGKHNDLDDVGHDTYHHTFFEMLGNWSFGDYFKKEAITWAWELLTKVWGLDQTRLHATYFGGDQDEGLEPDLEARDLWADVMQRDGLDATHIHAGNKKDNFWEMGETGPCGPCSEIHIDLTPGRSGTKLVNAGDARVMEIWNLVFIQFNRAADGKLTPLPAKHVDTGMGLERVTAILQGHNNNYATDLFVPIIQAIEKISGHTYGRDQGIKGSRDQGRARYACFVPGDLRDEACRVIADHIRCLTFAITDGAVPDREGRGYVLRRILRRAVRFGWQHLNLHEPFLYRLVDTVMDVMGEAFPELRKNPQHVKDMLREEEDSFERTLDRGIALFNRAAMRAAWRVLDPQCELVGPLPTGSGRWAGGARGRVTDPALFTGDAGQWFDLVTPDGEGHRFTIDTMATASVRANYQSTPVISGEDAFELHDTYGFPIDLTQVMAAEKGLRVDIAEYERLMEQARERARAGMAEIDQLAELLQIPKEHLTTPTDDSPKYEVESLEAMYRFATGWEQDGEDFWTSRGLIGLAFDRTCFYAEQGGQVGDRGYIQFPNRPPLKVATTKRSGDHVIHLVDSSPLSRETRLQLGERARLVIAGDIRALTKKNHTATHMLNWALREVLGDHIQQKGSLVDHEKTRFDFSHPRALTPEEIKRVEQLVNEKIRQNLPVSWQEVDQQQALQINGLRAVFGERYPERVRVLSVGIAVEELVKDPANPKWREVSIEFCGGTHVRNTADIGHFVITAEEAVAKGVRRIVAVTGPAAKIVEEADAALLLEAEELKRGPAEAVAAGLARLQSALTTAQLPVRHRPRIQALLADLQQIVKQQHKAEAADAATVVKERISELLKTAPKIGGATIVVAEMPDVPIEQLKHGADTIKQKCGSAAVLFGIRVAPETEPEAPTRGDQPSPDPSLERRGVIAPAAPAGKAVLLAALTPDLVKRGLKAGDLVKAIAPLVNGGGGGPPTMAQAGGKNPERLVEALAAGRKWIADRL